MGRSSSEHNAKVGTTVSSTTVHSSSSEYDIQTIREVTCDRRMKKRAHWPSMAHHNKRKYGKLSSPAPRLPTRCVRMVSWRERASFSSLQHKGLVWQINDSTYSTVVQSVHSRQYNSSSVVVAIL